MARDSARHHGKGMNWKSPDAQLARSNDTLRFIVGGKQFSWMNGEVPVATSTTSAKLQAQPQPAVGNVIHERGPNLERDANLIVPC